MITTRVIPSATASATTQTLLVEVVEKLCRKYCTNTGTQPTGTVTFTASPAKVVDGVAIFTVTANVTTFTPTCQECGCSRPQLFTETFDLAFTATTANTLEIVQGDNTIVEPAYRGCCCAKGIRLTTTLVATIS